MKNDTMPTTHVLRARYEFDQVSSIVDELLSDQRLDTIQRGMAIESTCIALGWSMSDFETMYLAQEQINVQKALIEELTKLAASGSAP